MKGVLIPTDFSASAWNAMLYAVKIFEKTPCQFYIFHAYGLGDITVSNNPVPDQLREVGLSMEKASKERLTAMLNTLKKYGSNPGHKFSITARPFDFKKAFQQVLSEKNIELIIMGTKGATGAKEVFLGTNTVHAIRKSNIPVLAIPHNFQFKGILKILFPTNYLPLYKPNELLPFTAIAKEYDARITVLHIKRERDLTIGQEENKELLRECLGELDYSFKEVEKQYVPDAINDYVNANDFDLLVMMNRKHSFLERLFLKQDIDTIGFHINVPFLVLKDTSKTNK